MRTPTIYTIIAQMLQSLCSLHRIQHKIGRKHKKKTSFPKKSVENTGFYKPVLSKIKTTGELMREIQFRSSLIEPEEVTQFILRLHLFAFADCSKNIGLR